MPPYPMATLPPPPQVTPVYEVAPHPDFNFKAGDTVLRLAAPTPTDAEQRAAAAVVEELPQRRWGQPAPKEPAAVAGEHAAAVKAAAPVAAAVAAAAAAPAAAVVSGRSVFHETMQTFLGGLAAPARAESAGEGGVKESDDEGEGEEVAEGSVSLGLSAWVGEILTVGPMLTVRWMDGTLGTAPPEELYVVNTDEEARPPSLAHPAPRPTSLAPGSLALSPA